MLVCVTGGVNGASVVGRELAADGKEAPGAGEDFWDTALGELPGRTGLIEPFET